MINYSRERKKDIRIILTGNKCDIESKREVSYEEALSYSENEGMFIETSALLSINIFEAFYSLVREINYSTSHEIFNHPSIKTASMEKNIET